MQNYRNSQILIKMGKTLTKLKNLTEIYENVKFNYIQFYSIGWLYF